MPKYLIGIAGPDGAGKSTLAKYLIEQFDNATKMAFADHLRYMLVTQKGYNQKEVYTKPTPQNIREALRTIALELKQCFWPSYFVEKLLLKVHTCNSELIVIDDVRYELEAQVCDFVVYLDLPYGNELAKLDSYAQLPKIHNMADLVVQSYELKRAALLPKVKDAIDNWLAVVYNGNIT